MQVKQVVRDMLQSVLNSLSLLAWKVSNVNDPDTTENTGAKETDGSHEICVYTDEDSFGMPASAREEELQIIQLANNAKYSFSETDSELEEQSADIIDNIPQGRDEWFDINNQNTPQLEKPTGSVNYQATLRGKSPCGKVLETQVERQFDIRPGKDGYMVEDFQTLPLCEKDDRNCLAGSVGVKTRIRVSTRGRLIGTDTVGAESEHTQKRENTMRPKSNLSMPESSQGAYREQSVPRPNSARELNIPIAINGKNVHPPDYVTNAENGQGVTRPQSSGGLDKKHASTNRDNKLTSKGGKTQELNKISGIETSKHEGVGKVLIGAEFNEAKDSEKGSTHRCTPTARDGKGKTEAKKHSESGQRRQSLTSMSSMNSGPSKNKNTSISVKSYDSLFISKITEPAKVQLGELRECLQQVCKDLGIINEGVLTRDFRQCSNCVKNLASVARILEEIISELDYSPYVKDLRQVHEGISGVLQIVSENPNLIILYLIEVGFFIYELGNLLGQKLLPDCFPSTVHSIYSRVHRLSLGTIVRQIIQVPASFDPLVSTYYKDKRLERIEHYCACRVRLLDPGDPQAAHCPEGFRTLEVDYDPIRGKPLGLVNLLNQCDQAKHFPVRVVTTVLRQADNMEAEINSQDQAKFYSTDPRPKLLDIRADIYTGRGSVSTVSRRLSNESTLSRVSFLSK